MDTKSVRKILQLLDEASQTWIDVYQANGVEGKPIIAEVPREDQKVDAVRKHLLKKGADAAILDNASLLAVINSAAPIVHRSARTGWREDNQVFVAHCFVTPLSQDKAVVPPECRLVGAAGQLEIRGTLHEWRKTVAVSRTSTAMTVALCAAFSAPLLKLVNRPSFGVVLFGPSRAGKSLAQLVGASALGFGREEDLPSLNASQAGLQAAALGFNDHLFPLNEIGTARGPKSAIYVALRDHTYALMNGQDTLRHPSWSGAGGGVASTFQTICLLSSEHSPDAWAARNGTPRDDGEMARHLGVPVLFSDRETIFDRPPPLLGKAAIAVWEKQQFILLREKLPQQRGVAFQHFLEALLANVAGQTARARQRIALFEQKIVTPTMSPVARDIVAKFGVLFAGGLCAVEAKILPLNKKDVWIAMLRACRAALDELPDVQAELRNNIAQLKKKLAGPSVVDLDGCPKNNHRLLRNADGFSQRRDNGFEYNIRAHVFVSWYRVTLEVRRVLEWLEAEGLLQHSHAQKPGRSLEWAQKHKLWPDGTRVRSISLFLPGGLPDLDL